MSSPNQFGPFELVRPLGVGGMAETALAIRRGEDGFVQRVCLKRILPAFSANAEFVRAFRAEAKLAVRLVHPHICRLYDFGAENGIYWMSMELAQGGDLRTLLARLKELGQPLPTDITLLLAIDLASALHYAHELVIDGQRAELVHRDISPSNVLLDEHGHFKLADFGIARAATHGHVTRSGVVKGKVPYMAPEHALGEAIDARADLWALGVVLYEAVTHERPFRGAHELETLASITKNQRRKIHDVAPGIPAPLQEVIERLLTVDLDARIASAAEVLDMLSPITPPATARLRLAELLRQITPEIDDSPAQPGSFARTEALPAAPAAERRASLEAPTRTVPLAQESPKSIEPSTAPSSARRLSRPLGALLFASALAVTVLVGWMQTFDASGSTMEEAPALLATAPSEVDEDAGTEDAGTEDAGRSTDTFVDAGMDAGVLPTRAEMARLTIVAVPFGRIWIDGRPVGAGRVTRTVAPGRHVIGVGRGAREAMTEAVVLDPGERRSISLRAPP